MQTIERRNRVFKSLHKPLTYLGVERTLFFFIVVGAVGAFNLFNSLIAGVTVFVGGYASGSCHPPRPLLTPCVPFDRNLSGGTGFLDRMT